MITKMTSTLLVLLLSHSCTAKSVIKSDNQYSTDLSSQLETALAKTEKPGETSQLEDPTSEIELYNYNNDAQYEYENGSDMDDLDEQE